MIKNYNALSESRDTRLKNQKALSFKASNQVATKKMSLIALFAMLLMVSFSSNAQVSNNVNPTYGYTFLNTTSTYTPLTGGTVFQSGTTLNTDAVSAAIPLPTPFYFNGMKQGRIFISNNGFITFGIAPTIGQYSPISSTSSTNYDGVISGFGVNAVQSSSAGASGEIRYGTAGSDFVIQFQDLGQSASTGVRMTFQIVLKADGTTVQIVYGPNNVGFASATQVQVGLRGTNDEDWNNRTLASGGNWNTAGGAAGTLSQGLSCTATTTLPTSGRTFQWTPNAYMPTYLATPFTTTQDFTTFTAGNGPNTVPSVNWGSNGYGNSSWQIDNTLGTTATSGWTSTGGAYSPVDFANAVGGHSARFHSFQAASGQVGYLDYYVDLSGGLGALTLDFYSINPSGTDILQVFLSTDGGLTFTQVGSNIGVSTTWTARSLSLGAVTSPTSIIRFKATADFGNDDIGIDNVKINQPLACPIPTSVTAGTLTANSATITWGCVGCTGTFDLDYGTAGHTAGTGTIVTGVTSGYVLSPPLTSNTAYTVYVRQDCTNTANGVGSWSPAVNFTTSRACPGDLGAGSVTVPSLPYSVTGQTTQGAGNNVTSANVACVAGSTSYYGAEDKTYIFTPTTTGTYTILLTTTTDDDAGIMLYQGCPFTAGSTCVANAQSTTGLTRTITPTLTSGVTYYLVVDNFPTPNFITSYSLSITPPASCAAPTGVADGSITTNSAAITWNCVGCTGTFELDYGTAGHTAGTGTIITGVTSGYVLSPPLTSSTSYTVYVRQDCSNSSNGLGAWSSAVNFTTAFDCAAAPFLTSNVAVTSGDLTGTGNFSVTACGFSTPGKEMIYQYTAPVTGTYTLDITGVNSGSGYIDYFYKPVTASACTATTDWVCIDDNNSVQASDILTLTGGVTYYILLDGEDASGSVANHTFMIVPPPTCTGAVGGTTSANVSSCGPVTPTITASGYSVGTVSGYQWEYSNDNFVADINDFIGQTNPAALTTGSVTATTYYRLRVTCDSGVATDYSNIVSVSIYPLPAPTVVTGGGTFCSSTTISATNGGDGTIYFQGTTSNGGSTAIPSSSEVITESGIYYFVTINDNGCIGAQGSVTVIIQPLADITGTPASVCQGGSGTIAASATNCTGFVNSGTALSGTFTAGDSQINRPTTSIVNTSTCSFDATILRGYQTQQFQVSVTGSYVFDMTSTDDGMAYITTGAFTPGSCATGTWIKGDDDSGPGNDPQLSMTLNAGITYTLYSTTYGTSNGNSTAAYSWTITPPVGGQIMLPGTGVIEWYTAASGGSAIGSGSPFNPVGVAGSGLANTNTPGTTVYYAACSLSNVCRTPVNFVINPATTTGSLTASAFGSYTWAAPSGNGVTYTNSGVYTYTTTDVNGCTNIATLTLTITPIVNGFNIGPSCGSMISSLSVTINAAIVPGATTYTFRVTNISNPLVLPFTINRPTNNFALSNYAGITLGTQYQIEVSVNGGATYGPPCTVFTPAPTSTIGAQCGTTLTSMSQWVYATLAPAVSGYRFRVTNNTTSAQFVYTELSGQNRFAFTQLPAAFVSYGTTYTVEVALKNTDGTFLPYGSGCNISTPAFPTSQIVNAQCNATATSNSQNFSAVIISGATNYRFQLSNAGLGYLQSVDRAVNTYNLSMFTGLQAGTTYTVRVAVRIGGVWGPLTGQPCNVTTPGTAPVAPRVIVADTSFKAIAYPNPFAENFMFDVTTADQGPIQVRVYDMLGKQVENRNVEFSDVNSLQIGGSYPSGVYNVIVSQGENTQTLRVIKR